MKKLLAVGVIVLFLGLAIAPSINADVNKISVNPIPDLNCEGVLSFSYPEPGETYYGSFVVQNIGEPDSLLDWEICDWPIWGTWTFEPSSWNDLTPEEGQIIVEVTVIWPEEINDSGEIKLVNIELPEDTCIIDLQITPKDKIVNELPEDLDLKDIRELLESGKLDGVKHPILGLLVTMWMYFRLLRCQIFAFSYDITFDYGFNLEIHYPILFFRLIILLFNTGLVIHFFEGLSNIFGWNWDIPY